MSSPDYDEQRAELSAVLQGALPAPRARRLATLIRNTIAIVPRTSKRADTAVGVSRLGGVPDLPAGMAWPTIENGDVAFVGQLRLEDLVALDTEHRLPRRGLLSFFHAFLTNGEYGPEARVFHVPDVTTLAPALPPKAKRRHGPKPTGVDFAARALLPPPFTRLVPREGKADAYDELFRAHYDLDDGDTAFHGLFGFGRPMEDEIRDDEEIILRLDAGGVPYDFVEAACAYFLIPKADLARVDFSRVRLYEGASI